MYVYDVESHTSVLKLKFQLFQSNAMRAHENIKEATTERSVPEGAKSTVRRALQRSLTGDILVLPAGAEDSKGDFSDLQASLCKLANDEIALRSIDALDIEATQDRKRQQLELRDPSVNHEWLWQSSPIHEPVVPPAQRVPVEDVSAIGGLISRRFDSMFSIRYGTQSSYLVCTVFCAR